MYNVEQPEPSPAFVSAWRAAALHLNGHGGDSIRWLRAHLDQPFAEHLSFLLGNQLFFVYVQAEEFAQCPTAEVFLRVSKRANAIPCLLPMQASGDDWYPALTGWGLRHGITGQPVDPADLVSDQKILMSDWEVHDVGMQVVMHHLQAQGKEVFSKQPDPDLYPQLWFESEGERSWVLVRASRSSGTEPTIAATERGVIDQLLAFAPLGFFASVVVVADSADMGDDNVDSDMPPLYRGYPLQVSFSGLQSLSTLN